MANGLGPFNPPRIQRRQIDPFALAQTLAAPEVARQQAKGQLFEQLGQLPQQAISTFLEFEDLKRKQALSQAELEFKKVQTKALTAGVPAIDPFTGQVKFIVPKGAKFIPGMAKAQEQKEFKKDAIGLLNEAEQTLKKIPSGLAFGGFEALKAKTGQGAPEAASYQATRGALAVKVYRGMTGDTKLSDADAAARALPLIPPITDASSVRAKKFARLKGIMSGQLTNPFTQTDLPEESPASLGFE